MITWSKRGRVRGILHAQQRDLLFTYETGVYAVQCSALYITSKGGGLIYSLDNPRAPSEVQLPCKYPPELRAGGRGQERDVKFREEEE